MFRITPKEGLKVINPDTMKRVSQNGIVVQSVTSFWTNRLNDGDVIIEDLSKKKTSKKRGSK